MQNTQTKILDILINSEDYVSGEEISEKLGISRQAVSKSVHQLKEQGFTIDSVKSKGHRLISRTENLCRPAVERLLAGNPLISDVVIVDSVDSTNNYAKKLARDGGEYGVVVAAREQTAGKGRLGRKWISQKNEFIPFSLLLKPDIAPFQVAGITPIAGLAVCEALRENLGLDCKIKWPNDIIVNNKKLVGILTEMSAEFDAVDFIVVGVGINVDQRRFPEEIRQKATSVFIETNKTTDKNLILSQAVKHLTDEFLKSNYRLNSENLARYKALCATLGREVSFYRGGRRLCAQAVDITETGELMVKAADGTVSLINSGEVTTQGIY